MTNTPTQPRRRVLFICMALMIPLLFAGLVEGTVRLLIDTPIVDDPYLNIGAVPAFFDTTRVDGRRHHRVSHKAAYRDREILFPVDKDPGTFRIFCLGGSASAGWPHPKEEIYSAYLEQALRSAYPNRKIEVINVSAHAYASYRVRFIFESVIGFDPDLLIIYSGNNEFLEPRSYLESGNQLLRTTTFLNRSATYRLALHFYESLRSPDASLDGGDRENTKYDKWSKVARVTLQLREDPVQFEKVKEHYAFNISSMVADAEEQGVPVLLATVPVNVRDWHPNVSLVSTSGEEHAEWERHYDAGQAWLLRGDPERARLELEAATQIDPTHAESYYYLGRALEQSGAFEQALVDYQRAVDLDHNPFRAVSAFNRSLRKIASQHANARLVDTEKAFYADSAPYAPGFDLLLDYVHPTERGNQILARTIFDEIVASGVLGEADKTVRYTHEPQPTPKTGELYDVRKDYFLQRRLLGLYGMMHQYEALVAKAEEFVDVPDFEPEKTRRILAAFKPYLELRRDELLGREIAEDEITRVKSAVSDYYGDEYRVPDMPSPSVEDF